MIPSIPTKSFAAKNWLFSHWVMTLFLFFNLGLGGYLSLQDAPRAQFSEAVNQVLLAILLGIS